MVNADSSGNSIEMGAIAAQKREPNGSLAPSLCQKSSEDGNQVYKLMIQIEKIRPKPCPKSKKLSYLAIAKRQQQQQQQPSLSVSVPSIEQKSLTPRKQVICSICNETFQSAQSLYLHKKKQHRYVCQICDAQCTTKVLFDKHEKLHTSHDSTLPYKCHLCSQKFDSRRNVRLHTRVMHSTMDLELEKSTASVASRDNATRPKSSHVKQIAQPAEKIGNAELREKLALASMRNEIERVGTYGAVTFTCRVCFKDFTTVEAAETHTREHMEVIQEEHKCNICKRLFRTESSLNTHLAEHLSRALRCPICPKAFINRLTLKVHMKSHFKG